MLIGKDVIHIKQEFGKTWIKVFYHNCEKGDWFNDSTIKLINTQTQFSIFGLLTPEFKIGNYYEFMIQYPSIPNHYNNWKQRVLPLDAISHYWFFQ